MESEPHLGQIGFSSISFPHEFLKVFLSSMGLLLFELLNPFFPSFLHVFPMALSIAEANVMEKNGCWC
jgi:hypothetical protein